MDITGARSPSGLVDTSLAAQHLGVSPHSLEVWRSTGRYKIPFVRVGRRVKYRVADLDRWLASRTVHDAHGDAAG